MNNTCDTPNRHHLQAEANFHEDLSRKDVGVECINTLVLLEENPVRLGVEVQDGFLLWIQHRLNAMKI